MKQLAITFTLLLVTLFHVNSQSYYKEGYIIKNNNDTIYGYIDYKVSKKNSFECIFKNHSNSAIQKYCPDDLKAYRFIDNKYYISRKINPEDSTKIFLEYLIDGIVDIFFYRDGEGDHYMIQKGGGRLIELRNELKVRYVDGKKILHESKEYVGILKNNFKDSPSSLKNAEEVSLYQNDLIKIAEDYHNEVCPGDECIIFRKEKSKLDFDFGILAGVSVSEISFKDVKLMVDLNDNLTSSTNFNFGAFVTVKDPLISEKLSLYSEASVSKNEFYTYEVNIHFISLKIVPVALRYSVPSRKVSPVFMLGLSLNNMLNLKDSGLSDNGSGIQHGRLQAGAVAGIGTEFRFVSDSKVFFLVKGEYLQGKHYNIWRTLGAGFLKTKVKYQSVVKCVSFTTGVRF